MANRVRMHTIVCVLALLACAWLPSVHGDAGSYVAGSGTVRNKIGFHLGPGGNQDHIQTYMTGLDSAGIPMFLKSVDAYGTIAQAVALRQKSGVDHKLVWRNTNFDTPDYSLTPQAAAAKHWNETMSQMPTNFSKQDVWLELINEPDQTKCDWLGQFGVAMAALSIPAGYNITMFSFATGNPPVQDPSEPCWTTPGMVAYLKLAAQHPDQLAVALHEYSLTTSNILNEYPYLVGRFKFLFDACDAQGIPRPKVHITEWGWDATSVPGPSTAVSDVSLVMTKAYAAYPQVQGGAIWFLGPGFGGIANQADQIVLPLTAFTLNATFPTAGPV